MRLRKIIGIMLLVIYAAFFASVNLCYHVHQIEDGRVVHSHFMWGHKTHNHTSMELTMIAQANAISYEPAEAAGVQPPTPVFFDNDVIIREAEHLLLQSTLTLSLRAPPAC